MHKRYRLFPLKRSLAFVCTLIAFTSSPARSGQPPLVKSGAAVTSVVFKNFVEANRSGAAVVTNSALLTPANIERRTFQLINEARLSNGLKQLEWHEDLYRMARAHSDSMADQDFFSHTDPRGSGMVKRALSLGLAGWQALGENLAYNLGCSDPAAFAVERWALSIKHRQNLLRPMFTHTAIGVAQAPDGRVFFTQVFGSK